MQQTCGPWIIAKWLTFLPRYKACLYHDKRYEYSLIKNESIRKKIDKIFLWQMLIEKPNRRKTAFIYYLLVRVGGWVSFYF